MNPITTSSVLIAIGLIAVLVYLTRISGYLLGLRIRHIGTLRPVLEALPGCAIIAILVPALRNGSLMDLLAMISVVGLMWVNNSVVLATVVGLGLLLVGHQL